MYYRISYKPLKLSAEAIGDFPPSYQLDDVPWIATKESYCQSNTLQMIVAQKGIEKPRGYLNFLMGFTYGAFEMPAGLGLFPYTDPETGFVVAAPYLGLVRRYYVTNDKSLYLDALRYYLSQGYPVRVGLNACTLRGEECQWPHSELLVGYDEMSFYYYETVMDEPRHLPPGEKGIQVPYQTLLEAVQGQAKIFSYPYRYSLTIFEEGPVEEDLGPIWARNGRSLIGGAAYTYWGAGAIERLAKRVKEWGIELDVSKVRWGIDAAAYTRRDNATYLREAFAGQADIERAADLFDEAAKLYVEALSALEKGIANQAEADGIAGMLSRAAAIEREIGKIFLARGSK